MEFYYLFYTFLYSPKLAGYKSCPNAKHYYKEALYATGIKKRPIIEPIGGIFKMVAQIPKMFMMVLKLCQALEELLLLLPI